MLYFLFLKPQGVMKFVCSFYKSFVFLANKVFGSKLFWLSAVACVLSLLWLEMCQEIFGFI